MNRREMGMPAVVPAYKTLGFVLLSVYKHIS